MGTIKRIDGDALLSQHSIAEIVGRHVSLKKQGSELVGICPFHNDSKASLQVNERKQVYACFACGAAGDGIDFLTRLGYSFHEACREIGGEDVFASGDKQTNQVAKKPKPLSWTHVSPAPERPTQINHYRHGEPSRAWEYVTADGQPAGYVCRFDTPEGKEVLPYVYATDGKRSEWRWMGFAKPRPLFNLDQVHKRPDATIIVVEGEKTAEAAGKLITKGVVTTWIGGAKAIHATDWTPLHGRRVILWPDNDWSHAYGEKHAKAGQIKPFHEQPGNDAMLQIAGILNGHTELLKWVKNDPALPCGWDVADEPDWNEKQVRTYVNGNLIDIPWPAQEEEPGGLITISDGIPPLPPIPEEPPPPFPPDESPTGSYLGHSSFFKFLGWNKDEGTQRYYFFQKEARTVLGYSASALTKSALITLAPLRFWQTNFAGSKGGVDTDAAQEFLIRTSIAHGPFNERYVRGRGAWVDQSRVVIHRGTSLIVDGKATTLGELESRFIYETSDDLGIDPDNPLTTKEANQLIEIAKLLNWDRDINAYLLAGWCVVAPVCGALKWRPHIWLTGAAGTGKSWVFLNIVRRMLGPSALAVQGETSEAGLRQTLGHDAMPVVFDEAEIDDKRSAERIQNILALMRSASADNGGLLLKGSATGQAKSYHIRSCFAFASIGIQAAQQADRSRITILSMKQMYDKDLRQSRWEQLQRLYNASISDEYADRLRARTVSILPVLLRNAETFSNAAAAVLGEQRAGDQLGALLAGAYSLFSTSEISFEDAKKWVADKDWSEERGLQGTKDELALFSFIMQTLVTVENYDNRKFERAIGELVGNAGGFRTEFSVTQTEAADKLARLGIRVVEDKVYISNSAKYITNLLKETAWAKNHNKILLRLNHAVEKDSMRFGTGVTTRAVGIPLEYLRDEA